MHSMSEMSDRLRQARKLAGYETGAEVCSKNRWLHYPTYMGHENGNRGFSNVAPSYARLFRVNLIWLMTGRGEPRPKSSQHPIVGLFEAIPSEKQSQAIEYLEFLASKS